MVTNVNNQFLLRSMFMFDSFLRVDCPVLAFFPLSISVFFFLLVQPPPPVNDTNPYNVFRPREKAHRLHTRRVYTFAFVFLYLSEFPTKRYPLHYL